MKIIIIENIYNLWNIYVDIIYGVYMMIQYILQLIFASVVLASS